MTGSGEGPEGPGTDSPLDQLGIGSAWIKEGWPTQPRRSTATTDIGTLLGCSLADLDDWLETGAVPVDNLSAIIGGVHVPQKGYTQGENVDPVKLRHLREGGATVGLRGLTQLSPAIGKFGGSLSDSLGEAVQVNAYLTPPGHQGFAHHYDTHTVVIVQISGTKVWELFEPVVVDPVFPYQQWTSEAGSLYQRQLPNLTAWAEWTLNPGDVLWVPRGWIHNPYASADSSEPSLHLTLGVLESTYVGALDRLARVAAQSEAMRKALPPATTPDVRAEALREALREWVGKADLRRVFE